MRWKWLVGPTASTAGKLDMTVTIPPNVPTPAIILCVCVCVCLHMPLTEQVVAEIHVPTAPGTLVKEENMLDMVAEAEGHSTIIAKGSGTHRFFATTLGAN